jgi:hypothetical protein
MVDLHAHVFATAAFGGRWHWGRVEGKKEEALAACDCDPHTHASAGGLLFREAIGVIPGITDGDTGLHCKKRCGDATYAGWPRWDTLAHMQYFEGHLKQALDDGLRLMVVQAVESLPMCQQVEKAVTEPASPDVYDCDWGDSFESLKRQIQLARHFDQKNEWVEIAESPADARRILSERTAHGGHKMVWVLGIEADYAWGNAKEPIDLRQRLHDYHAMGVRAIYLANHVNTPLAGAAIFFDAPKTLQWVANCFFLGSNCRGDSAKPSYELRTICPEHDFVAGTYGELCDAQILLWKKKDGFANFPGGGVDWVDEDGELVEKNHLGLTTDGRKIVGEMMKRGVLIDITHISEKAVADVAQISADHGGYPLFASHGYFRERLPRSDGRIGNRRIKRVEDHFYNKSHEATLSTPTARLIASTGGMVGHFTGPDPQTTYQPSGIQNDCFGSTKSLAQGLAWGIDQGVKLGFATDFMGMMRGLAPRGPGEGQCLKVKGQQRQQKGTLPAGDTEFQQNGFAHIGLMGAVVRDLEHLGFADKYLEHVRDDAVESFLQMWERAEYLK